MRAEYGNLILAYIRSRIADHVVYQSEFARGWWCDWYGVPRASWSVVHNGIDLTQYRPDGPAQMPANRTRLLIVEGSLGGGYDMGLENALKLAEIGRRITRKEYLEAIQSAKRFGLYRGF